MRTVAVIALPFALVASSLTGCGLLGGSDSLDDALEVVPASMTEVRFFDREAALDRLDIDDLQADPSDDELEAYVDASREVPTSTALDQYLLPMLADAPFSAQDIEWEITGYDTDNAFGRVWKMDDDLDLDDVADDLVDLGFAEEAGDGRHLSIDLDGIGEDVQYLVPLQSVSLLPDDHLVVTGPLADDFLDVISDDADSAVDEESFDELLDGTDDVELAVLSRDAAFCSLGASRLSADQLGAAGLADLGHPDQTAFFVHGDDGKARSVLQFADEAAADDDAEAREQFLAEAVSPVSGVPYSEFGTFDVEADGEQVRIDVTYDDPRDIPAVIGRNDYPSVCVPDAG
jgi:hypothetical protein